MADDSRRLFQERVRSGSFVGGCSCAHPRTHVPVVTVETSLPVSPLALSRSFAKVIQMGGGPGSVERATPSHRLRLTAQTGVFNAATKATTPSRSRIWSGAPARSGIASRLLVSATFEPLELAVKAGLRIVVGVNGRFTRR